MIAEFSRMKKVAPWRITAKGLHGQPCARSAMPVYSSEKSADKSYRVVERKLYPNAEQAAMRTNHGL